MVTSVFERALDSCIRLRHTGPSSDVKVWGATGYTSWSPLVCLDGTLNSARCISGWSQAEPFSHLHGAQTYDERQVLDQPFAMLNIVKLDLMSLSIEWHKQ
ncbi:hypothetical protein TNCV_3045651 [Trichonephila clavipes]|uniref:Uncharacterized protein n=1 Tax=Trichonephila clavipes TaxID=2585209 RepID=A0A8X6V0R7_TRICX|nr:hypothetical protein TNCV_3045651 [Trichonephila clavipes]